MLFFIQFTTFKCANNAENGVLLKRVLEGIKQNPEWSVFGYNAVKDAL